MFGSHHGTQIYEIHPRSLDLLNSVPFVLSTPHSDACFLLSRNFSCCFFFSSKGLLIALGLFVLHIHNESFRACTSTRSKGLECGLQRTGRRIVQRVLEQLLLDLGDENLLVQDVQ